MSYRILLFGAEAATVGSRHVDLDLDGDAVTTVELKEHLQKAYPDLTGVPTCRVAVNQRFVDDHEQLTADDEIALIGPVSGG